MTASVYIESSIISYLTARPSRDLVTASRQAITAEWWLNSKSHYEVYISALVEEEISGGDPTAAEERLRFVANIPSLAITDEAQALAGELLSSKAVPANSTQGADYLLTWNFKHIKQCRDTGAHCACCRSEWLDVSGALLP